MQKSLGIKNNLKSKPISPSIKKNEGWTNFPIGPGIDYDNNHFC